MIWWFVASMAVFVAHAIYRRNWWMAGLAVVLTAYPLLDGETFVPMSYWFAGTAALLLIVAAPRPAWVALVVAGLAAIALQTLPTEPLTSSSSLERCPPNTLCNRVILEPLPNTSSPVIPPCPTNNNTICLYATATRDLSTGGERSARAEKTLVTGGIGGIGYGQSTLPFEPAWLVVAGVLGWAIRRRSWRVAVAAAMFGGTVYLWDDTAWMVAFAAAAAAIGPRKDPHYLVGLGILTLALMDQDSPWTLAVTIVAIAATLALGTWALTKKNGLNGTVALVALATAPLTPFLTAGVLLAYSLIRRTAEGWAGTPSRRPAG